MRRWLLRLFLIGLWTGFLTAVWLSGPGLNPLTGHAIWVTSAYAKEATVWQDISPNPMVSTVPNLEPNMVIEWLKFDVEPDLRAQYLATDAKIWTPALESYPGFIDKVTWLEEGCDREIIFVIRWASREQWKAIPEAELEAITQAFDATFGHPYKMLESKEFYPH